MKQSVKFILTISAAATLAACGGGGDGDVSPSTPELISYSQGDSYTYSIQHFAVTGSAPTPTSYRFTRTIRSPLSNNAHERLTTYSTQFNWGTAQVNGSNVVTETTSGGERCVNTAGQTTAGFTFELGETWTSQVTSNCATNSTAYAIVRNWQGRVVSKEPYNSALGVFETFKVETQLLEQRDTQSSAVTETCWFDIRSAQAVACDSLTKVTPAGASSPQSEYRTERRLTSLAARNHPQSNPTVERFAGSWRINWSGSNSGACTVQVSLSGALSGSCEPGQAPFISFSVSGSVSNAGAVTANSPNGGRFTGSFEDPAFGRGTWSNTGTSGTWTAGHL